MEPAVAARARASLERAFERHGVIVAETGSAHELTTEETLAELRTSLEEARTSWRRGDAKAVLEETRAALAAFHRGPAFTDDAAAWAFYRDALTLRALALVDEGNKAEAASALRTLVVAVPLHVPTKDRETAALAPLFEKVREEVRMAARVPLEVRSVPAGASVLVDGKERGLTPLLVEDVVAGTHHVAVRGPAGLYTERVEVGEDGARVLARLGGRNLAAVRAALDALKSPVTAEDFTGSLGRASDDALVAVLLPAGKRVEIVAARVRAGVLGTVAGTRVPDSDNERERATYLLVEALLAGGRDAWVDAARDDDPGLLRPRLLSGMGTIDDTGPDPDREQAISPATVAVGVLAGVALVGSVAIGLGVAAWREARKDTGFTFTVSTGDL